jgi:hypothetical protein
VETAGPDPSLVGPSLISQDDGRFCAGDDGRQTREMRIFIQEMRIFIQETRIFIQEMRIFIQETNAPAPGGCFCGVIAASFQN